MSVGGRGRGHGLQRPGCSASPPPQVSTQLYSTREKEQLAGLVGTMLAYSLTYRQERAADGQYTYRLEP